MKAHNPGGETNHFEFLTGVLPGESHALYLIVLGFALSGSIDGKEETLGYQIQRRRRRRIVQEFIRYFDSADDTALLS